MRYLKLLVLLLVPSLLVAQHRSKVLAVADSGSKHFEVGTDMIVSQTGDSLPGDVRIGLLLGKNASIEYSASAQRGEGYLEAKLELGILASVIPGSSNRSGEFVRPHVALHYDGGPSQFGYGLGAGMRVPTGPITVRMEMYTTFYQATAKLPAFTDAGAKAGVSYYF
jgi:hypothetical protein